MLSSRLRECSAGRLIQTIIYHDPVREARPSSYTVSRLQPRAELGRKLYQPSET